MNDSSDIQGDRTEWIKAVVTQLARVKTDRYETLRERWLAAHDLYKTATPLVGAHYQLWTEVAAAEEAAWREYRASLG